MGQKKTTLVSYLVQAALAAAVAVAIYMMLAERLDVTTSAHRIYAEVPAAWHVRCWSDALFIPAVLWVGMGGLMWVATTGFFDIFRYGFSSLLVLFTPFKNPKDHKKFYEYKLEREEKRKGKSVPVTILVVGIVLMAGALVLSFVHEDMVAPYAQTDLPGQSITITQDAEMQQKTDAVSAGEESGEEPVNDVTGGEENE